MDPDVLEWRILGYLAYRRRNASNSYEGHEEHIQPEIARAVGKARSLCSRKLASLIDMGYVESFMLHTPGNRRRRNVYYLTDDGYRLVDGRLKQPVSRVSDRRPTWTWDNDSNTWIAPQDG